jgi:tetratricopeptide (TPR) repeat protein
MINERERLAMPHPNARLKKLFWAIILLSLCLTPCSNALVSAPPTDIPLEGRVGQLQATNLNLLGGETTDIRVGVVKVVGVENPFEYEWSTTGGIITYGLDTCCITYQAPETAGQYQVNVVVKYGDQAVQRSLTVQVTALPTPTVPPTPVPTPVLPTSTPSSDLPPLSTAQEYFDRAQNHYLKRDYEHTIADYTLAIELNYEPLKEPYYNRGYVYYVQRDYDRAIADFTKAIELNYEPLSLPYYNRGNAHYYKGNNDRAIADYTKTIELNHDPLSWVYNSRGLAYRKKGDYDQAIADYTQAIELGHEPLNWPYYNRGNAYADKGAYPQAIADYDQALLIDSSSADVYHARGLAYKKSGNAEQAIANFNKVLELGDEFLKQEAQIQLQELGAP